MIRKLIIIRALKYLFENKGISIRKVASKFNISHVILSKWKKQDEKNIKVGVLMKRYEL